MGWEQNDSGYDAADDDDDDDDDGLSFFQVSV